MHLYRGLVINAASMAPITATQFGTNRLMENVIQSYTGAPVNSLGRFGCAAIAGGVSAFIGSPSELIIIQQQRSGRALAAEVRNFLSRHAPHCIYRGITACIARETMYAAGYLGLCPVLNDALRKQGYTAGTSLLVSGMTGGIFAAAMSQPFDTMKTRMQAFMYDKKEYHTLVSTAKQVYAEGGLARFWAGLIPRMTRIIAATFILNTVRTTAVGILEDRGRVEVTPAVVGSTDQELV